MLTPVQRRTARIPLHLTLHAFANHREPARDHACGLDDERNCKVCRVCVIPFDDEMTTELHAGCVGLVAAAGHYRGFAIK